MESAQPCLATEFAAAMEGLGPFEPSPRLAVAVSGGADSMALAILARDWARQRDGSILALIIDHGLRPASAEEAQITVARLTCLGIQSRLLHLSDLRHGARLAERARIMRYAILAEACRNAGILHLLLGHHAADQNETLAMRVLRGSQTHGLAGMAALREMAGLRLLRPLLTIDPVSLRRLLTAHAIEWVEDPSNHDTRALRPRLRQLLLRQRLAGTAAASPQDAMAAVAGVRTREEAGTAAELACRVRIRPEGFAELSPGRISPGALSRLIQTIGAAPYPPHPDRINALAAQPEPATLAGVRIMPASRPGTGLLIVREEAAMMAPVEARQDTVWDHRFRIIASKPWQAGTTIGKLGAEAARFRQLSGLPSVILRTLPAVWSGECLAAVPHLDYVDQSDQASVTVLFSPPRPIAGPCFLPARQDFGGRADFPVVIPARLVDDHHWVGM